MIPKYELEKVKLLFESSFNKITSTLKDSIVSSSKSFGLFSTNIISNSGFYAITLKDTKLELEITSQEQSCIALELMVPENRNCDVCISIDAPKSFVVIKIVCEKNSNVRVFNYEHNVFYYELDTVSKMNSILRVLSFEQAVQTLMSKYSSELLGESSVIDITSYHIALGSKLFHEGALIAAKSAKHCLAKETLKGIFTQSKSELFLEPILDISSGSCESSHSCSYAHITNEQSEYAKARGIENITNYFSESTFELFIDQIPEGCELFKQKVLGLRKH
jgi:hypothetical protein